MAQKKSCETCRHVQIKKELYQGKDSKKVIKRLYCNEFHEFLKGYKACDDYVFNTHLHKT